ncbi:uncharacterized protein B0T15DRAFT_311516 [Chaetomium strumarium]|uniref:Uncharacterized protein n=1 Tax=Chaetomium strumarium TaxID=1170767 RepID=A0AAJ0GMF8_9PEZI|nr:hypothetical protein B0T15DRAFT_311516 [Chaetomium strumarium]
MCLTKVYYNTYSDGAQDITEKHYPCGGGRGCAHNEVRKYDRKFPFTKLGDVKPESYRSLSERQPTPYFSHAARGAKSPSVPGRRDSGVYYDYNDPYDGFGYHHSSSSRHDPRDRDRHERGRDRGDLRLKRSATNPQIVYVDRDGKSSSRSRSGSRDYSRDIPLGLVPLADEYGRRRHSSSSRSRSREGSRDESDHHYYYRRTDDPHGYVLIDDQDEQRRRRRREEKHRRLSTSSYTEPSSSSSAAAAAMAAGVDAYQYMPRRASTVVHRSDGSISTSSGGVPKQLRWEDQVRAKRERQNAEIASRAASSHGEVKGILKHTGDSKGKGRELDDIAELRRAVERMEIPRGRDREPRSARGNWEGWGGYDDYDSGRRKRSKVYADDRYRY